MNRDSTHRVAPNRKWSLWKFAGIWTAGHLVASLLIALFSPELLRLFLPIASLSASEMLIVSFFTPPIVTVWGIGVASGSYKCRMLCAVPTVTIIATYLVSAVFSFPFATLFSVGTMIVMVYTLAKNWGRHIRPC